MSLISLIELTYKARVLLTIHYSKHEKFTYFRSKKKLLTDSAPARRVPSGVGTIRKLGGHQLPAALFDDERALKKWKTCAKCAICCT